jgi:LacI family repressor for deo operon, udp, cdd, tsx, nupC, and nupG
MKRPSSRDVARRAGVSQATVSHVINGASPGKHRVAPETRERVLQAIRELGYQPNGAARALRTRRTQLVALLTPDLTNPFYPVLAQAIQDVFQAHGYELLVSNSRGDAALERRFLDNAVRRGADGAVVVAWHLRREDVEQALQAGLGLVSVGGDFGHTGIGVVASRDHRGAIQAVRYLLRKGHRRIAHIGGDPGSLPGRLRLESYHAAIETAGLPVQEDLIVFGDFTRGSAQAPVRALMARDDPPSAIFAANDTMAVDALLAIQELGFRVPDDVAIVGYDDTTEARLVRPQLTTVRQPVAAMGRAAAELLLERIGDQAAAPRRVIFEPELIVRGSA